MQKFPGLALAKASEELSELLAAYRDTNDVKVGEASDLFAHLFMALNGMGLRVSDICNELNKRQHKVSLFPCRHKISDGKIRIVITSAKYADKTYRFVKDHLGIVILPPQGRSLKLDYSIVDEEKYRKTLITTHYNV